MAAPPSVPLPIDPLLPEIVAALREERALVLEAPPGAGKTTRVPRALLEAGLAGTGEVVVLQPRRLPTRLAAQRVADELGERVGDRVGYQVRFEDISGPRTRLRFVTEGVLGRRLLSDPELRGVAVVVLDEFHERHLAGDLALAQLRLLQRRRPELRLLAMSATLEAGPVAEFLGARRLRSEGRRFQVEVEYLDAADDRHLDVQVAAGVKRVVAAGRDGDILVFLPGAGEIRRSMEALSEFAGRHQLDLLPLHGELSPAEQDRAVRPGKRRKIILSTNVAETSVTIEGVGVVIDTGLARTASHSPWTGMPALKLTRVSKAAATQRAGRAGRTREGHCLRLYTRHDFETRPDHEVPEIRRLDLAETVLALRASGVADLQAFPFFEAPPPASLEAAEELLRRLGAVTTLGAVTDLGRRLLKFPVHPRQGRLLVEAERRGVGEDGAVLAAILGERELRREARAGFGRGGARPQAKVSAPSDLLEILERFEQAERAGFASGKLHALELDPGATLAVDRVRKQLRRLLDRTAEAALEKREGALLMSVLAGFPDRVAQRRRARSPELLLHGGGSATLSELSVVQDAAWMVAVDVEERSGARGQSGAVVRLASAIEPDWLLELFPDEIRTADEPVWNEAQERVEQVSRLSYGNLVLDESRTPAAPSAEVGELLAHKALAAGLQRFADVEALERLLARLTLLAQASPELELAVPDEAFLRRSVASLAAAGLRSFAELREASLQEAVRAQLTPEQARALERMAPERVTLPGGRTVQIQYPRGQPPFIASRLQDFFGLAQGPAVAGGRIPLVLHLLAPNQRAVQVTTDLAGFWERHYPSIRKELMRRYPRHAWPEDPRRAQPPTGGRLR